MTVRPSQHPVCGQPHTLSGANPGAFTRKRGVPGLTLVRGVVLDADTLLRHRARRFHRVNKCVTAFKPVYRRRDMLGALLYVTLSRAGVTEMKLAHDKIASIALERDEETGETRVSVRAKRQQKKAST